MKRSELVVTLLVVILLMGVACGTYLVHEGVLEKVECRTGWFTSYILTFEDGTVLTVWEQPRNGYKIGGRFRIEKEKFGHYRAFIITEVLNAN